jgi:hypothetical protein
MDFNNVVFNTVKTLRLFEKGFTSCKRTPVDYQTRPESLSEFIEIRLNFESFKVKELEKLEQMMDGRLFVVKDITNERNNSYDKVVISLNENKPEMISDEDYINLISNAKVILGGSTISFSSDKRNLNIVIE